MKKLRVILILTVFLVLSIFIGSAIRSYYLFLKEPLLPIVNCLPQNTAVIFKTSSAKDLLASINNSSAASLFKQENGTYHQIVAWFDSIALKDQRLSKLLNNNELILALIPDNNNKPQLLIATSIGKSGVSSYHKQIKNTLADLHGSVSIVDNNLRRIDYNETNLWYFIKQGLLVVSPNKEIIENSLSTITSSRTLENDESFKKINLAGGKRVDAVMIINNKNLLKAIWPSTNNILKQTPFEDWTTFDINIQKNELLLGGFTFTHTSNMFEGQTPVEFDHLKYYPLNTAFSMSLALSDQVKYTSNFLKTDTLHVSGYDASIKSVTKEVMKPSDHLKEWIGNSVSLFLLHDYFKGNEKEKLILVSHRNSELAKSALKPYIKPLEDSIGQMYYSDFTRHFWGSYFNLSDPVYIVVTEDNVALSSSITAIKTFSSDYKLNDKDKPLSRKLLNLGEHSSKTSNLFIYLNPKVVLKWFTNSKHGKGDNGWIQPFSNIDELGFQYSAGNNLQFTHSWLIPSGSPMQTINQVSVQQESAVKKVITQENEKTSINELSVEAGIKAPQVVSTRSKSAKNIITFTSDEKLNMHDHQGELLWSFKLKGVPSSEVFEIDYNKDGKIHYLVATSKYLHIINSEGKEVSKSPVKLPSPLKSGLAIFDYDKRNDYRLLYIGNDNLLHNITLAGIELPDWNKPKVKGEGKIDFLRTNGKDYLLFSSSEGLRIFDRRGRDRVKLGTTLLTSPNTKVFENKTNSKGIFLTVTKQGELAYVNEKGLVSTSSFGTFGKNPWFNYMDYDSDGSMDFMFCGNDKLIVYTRMKDKIISIIAKEGSFGKPFIYSSSSRDKWIFVRNTKTSEVTAFHNKARVSFNKTLKSETDPVVFNPGGSLKETIITTWKGKLLLTPLN